MTVVWRTIVLTSAILIIHSVSSSPIAVETNNEQKEDSDIEGKSNEKELPTVSPEEMEKLKEDIIENQEENAKKFGIPFTISPEKVEVFLEEEEKIEGTELPEKIEKELSETKTGDEYNNFAHFIALFDQIEDASAAEEERKVVKSPAEMKKMKSEILKSVRELAVKQGLPELTEEEYDNLWNQSKEKYGDRFPAKVEKLHDALKNLKKEEEETDKEDSEDAGESSTPNTEPDREEPPNGAFAVKNAKGKICILAKFESSITITYPGKSSDMKVEMTVPHGSHTKGKCGGNNKSPSMQISWGKFVFALLFNKTSEDLWSVGLVELTYDTSEPLFDGAANREKVTVKSKKVNLFESPVGKSYFCPAQEVIVLSGENNHGATVRLKDIQLQPYDVGDGNFSPFHRCNQVVIGGLDEEPFVQDETVPLAVGCTLALITLLILVGFAVHRAYHAAKVDYNTVE